MRIPDPTSFVSFLVRLGWATTRTRNPPLEAARARVFFFRGQAIVFSAGFGRLCDRLRREGVWAEDLRCRGERWACRRLRADASEGSRMPVVLVGHSCGGRSTVLAARELQADKIGVDLIVCLDTACPPAIPGNVRRAVHLYLAGPRLYPARPLRSAPGAAPVIENVVLNGAGSPVSESWLHHFNITNRPSVQEVVLGYILDTVNSLG